MNIKISDFCVEDGKKVKLKKIDTDIKPLYDSKEDFQQKQKDHIKEMSELQNLLYAHNSYSLLIIFQAMDGAGKDSAIKHVMSGRARAPCRRGAGSGAARRTRAR